MLIQDSRYITALDQGGVKPGDIIEQFGEVVAKGPDLIADDFQLP